MVCLHLVACHHIGHLSVKECLISEFGGVVTTSSVFLFKTCSVHFCSVVSAVLFCHIFTLLAVHRSHCLQCFDAVGWAAGRACKLSGGVLVWFSVWS